MVIFGQNKKSVQLEHFHVEFTMTTSASPVQMRAAAIKQEINLKRLLNRCERMMGDEKMSEEDKQRLKKVFQH